MAFGLPGFWNWGNQWEESLPLYTKKQLEQTRAQQRSNTKRHGTANIVSDIQEGRERPQR